MAVDVKWNVAEVLEAGNTLRTSAKQRILSGLGKKLVPLFAKAEREFKRRLSGPILRVRTGAARASIRHLIEDTGRDTLRAEVGVVPHSPAEVYLAKHIRGRIIRPTRAKYLAIPVGEALTARGVPRYKSPRDLPDLFPIRRDAGTILLARRTGRGARSRLQILFVLKRQIRLPKRDWLAGVEGPLISDARAAILKHFAKRVTTKKETLTSAQ